ncbi:MAG: arginase family protein [Deltaproteobacteria bacterium]|nr:arginase family protein [Deltaproteobacteria bacterium]
MPKKIKDCWAEKSPNSPGRSAPARAGARRAVELLGAPDDRGVLNVGGRLGANRGPAAARRALSQFMLGMDGAVGRVRLGRGFDVAPGLSIEEAHQALREAVADALRSGVAPLVLGGGHDYGYPHVAGAFDALGAKIALINVDAHLDVRPPEGGLITSGSPFFLALESGVVRPRNFVEFGIQEHCNDAGFGEYIRKKRAKVVMLNEARAARGGAVAYFERLVAGFIRKKMRVVVSFDVDSVQMAHAPGVSAPQADGFTASEFLGMAAVCGEYRGVATIGFFELAPALDLGGMTARLVATAMHRYLSALGRQKVPA